MSRIAVLGEELINRIAAGEVIERPASVVKELVENSIDAGAKRITVKVEGDPSEFIQVVDDGCGMEKDDVLLAFERHATSKLRDPGELFSIETLGFRGEALPSIASVSWVEMVSRPRGGGPATRIQLKGGERVLVGESAGPEGTSVVVRDIFFNTPARRKYLKSVNTEGSHVYDVVSSLALSHPEISFRLYRGERLVLSTDGSGDYLGAVTGVYGSSLAKELVPVSLGLAGASIFALIGKPHISRSGRDGLRFYVNGRAIQSRTIAAAVEKAFGGAIPRDRHPVAFVWLSIDAASVDVNVHPTKREVRFLRESDIYRIAFEATRQSLRQARSMAVLGDRGVAWHPGSRHPNGQHPDTQHPNSAAIYYAGRKEATYRGQPQTAFGMLLAEGGINQPGTSQPDASLAGMSRPVPDEGQPAICEGQAATGGDQPTIGGDQPAVTEVLGQAPVFVIGQFSGTYILVQGVRDLYIVDQHAAHERILYERVIDSFDRDSASAQQLLVPVPLELEPRLAHEVEGKMYLFERTGFKLEPFGQNAFLVRSIPALIAGRPGLNVEDMLRDMVAPPDGEDGPGTLRLDLHRLAATIACKGAIKAGDQMHYEEMERLVSDLLSTRDPLLCPHGRPTMISLPLGEIERRFRRPPAKGSGSG